MTLKELLLADFGPELSFSTSRSSGAGGQNVNKVETKVELRFKISGSLFLSEFQSAKIREKFKNQINQEDELIIVSQESRSQFKNKQETIKKFKGILKLALTVLPKRKPTRPTKSKIEKRLKSKKLLSDKKSNRSKVDF